MSLERLQTGLVGVMRELPPYSDYVKEFVPLKSLLDLPSIGGFSVWLVPR